MKKLLFLITFLIPFNAFAEPSKSVAYLMNEPFSMFEWGLYRLEDSLKETEFKDLDLVNRTLYSVDYEWEKNLIGITLTIYPRYSSFSKSDPKNICRSAITTLKGKYGYGWEKDIRPFVSIIRFFQHKGYAKKNEPENLMNDLETMTKVTVQVYASKKDKPSFSEQCSCTSRLLEEAIFFLDKENKNKP